MPPAQETPAGAHTPYVADMPDNTVSVRQTFGLNSDLQVPAFCQLFFLLIVIEE